MLVDRKSLEAMVLGNQPRFTKPFVAGSDSCRLLLQVIETGKGHAPSMIARLSMCSERPHLQHGA
jgi:hypothetical protein